MANTQDLLDIISESSRRSLLEAKRNAEALNKELQETILYSNQVNENLAGSQNNSQLNTNSERQREAQERVRRATAAAQLQEERLANFRNNEARRQAERTERQNRQTTESSREYRRLSDELNRLRRNAQDVAVTFGTNSREFRNASREVDRLDQQLRQIDSRLGVNSRNVGNYFNDIKSALTSFALQALSIQAVIGGISKIFSNNKEISDALSDVRRTSQLTQVEADKLLETFKGFDTRTSLKGLLDIATIAGQLGIAKDDVAGFTKSIDQLSVVLGSEIPGGAEAVATALGKINGVFRTQVTEGTDIEEAYNRTGSAILGLGQAGLATGEFLTDFTQRVGGAAVAANISLPTILAYGSVLEEAGSSAEVAGTALNRLIGNLSTDRKEFFAIAKLGDANLTFKEFTKTINTDANKALEQFFKGLNSGNPTLTQFNDRIATIGIASGPAKNAIISLAQNQEKLSEKIRISTKDYYEADKITEQIALKNDNLAGSVDRLNKTFENATTSGSTGRFFKGIVDYLNISLSEFNKLVNSKSWSEFWSRLSNNGGDVFELNQKINSVTKRTNDNQEYLYPRSNPMGGEKKIQELGAKGTKSYLEKLKKTYEEAANAEKKFSDGIKKGTIVEEHVGELKDLTNIKNKAKTYYDDVFKLYKKFGFDKQKEKAKQDLDNTDNPFAKTKRGGRDNSKVDMSEFDFDKSSNERTSKSAKRIIDDEKNELSLRLDALEIYTNAETSLIKNNQAKKIKQANGNKLEIEAINQDAQNEYEDLLTQSSKKELEIRDKADKELVKLFKEGIEEQAKLGRSAAADRAAQNALAQEELSKGVDSTLEALASQYAKGDITEEEYNQRRINTIKEFNDDAQELELNGLQAIIDIRKDFGIDTYSDEERLAELRKKIAKDVADYTIEQDERIGEAENRLKEKRKEFAMEAFSFATDMINNSFEKQTERINREVELNEQKKNLDIENVNESVLSEEQKEERIKIIEAQSEQRQLAIEQKRQEIEVRKARFQKAAAITEIAISTASAVAKITAGAAVNSLIPIIGPVLAAKALAQIPFVIGIGALQAAAILSQPIPKFAHGKDENNNYEGPAWVGDGGMNELVINKDGSSWVTPNKPTLTYVGKDTEVISGPALAQMRMMAKPDGIDVAGKSWDVSPLIVESQRSTKEMKKAISQLAQRNKRSSRDLDMQSWQQHLKRNGF